MIALKDVSLRSGTFELTGVSLVVPFGSYGVLMGRTGCGKTTLLEAICGLGLVQSGRIQLGDRDVTALHPADRHVGYVPQDLALFPSMTVRQNLAFALEVRGQASAAVARRVDELAALLGVAPLLERRPKGLSGGEAQRVALGRALAAAPPVLLLDEPLSALDESTHADMIALLQRVQRLTGVTVLHVTHNRFEAETLADTLFILEEGVVRSSEKEIG
jgi:molybdate/tungstate transport system ATP-binding protein